MSFDILFTCDILITFLPLFTCDILLSSCFLKIIFSVKLSLGTAVAQWLRCCATNRKVAGVIGIFHWHNPPDRTMALGSTQPLTEMSTRRISWG